MQEQEHDDADAHEDACLFRPPPMPDARGASLPSGGRRLSGRRCWTFDKNGSCPFGDACKYLHHHHRHRHDTTTSTCSDGGRTTEQVPGLRRRRRRSPLKYMLLKAVTSIRLPSHTRGQPPHKHRRCFVPDNQQCASDDACIIVYKLGSTAPRLFTLTQSIERECAIQ